MLNLYFKLRSLTSRQEGQGMVEYALILVLVSIVVIVILLTMGNQIKNVFSNVVAALEKEPVEGGRSWSPSLQWRRSTRSNSPEVT